MTYFINNNPDSDKEDECIDWDGLVIVRMMFPQCLSQAYKFSLTYVFVCRLLAYRNPLRVCDSARS